MKKVMLLLLLCCGRASAAQPAKMPEPTPTPVMEESDRFATRPTSLPVRGDAVRSDTTTGTSGTATAVDTEDTDPPLPPSADQPQQRRRIGNGQLRQDFRTDVRNLRNEVRNRVGNTNTGNTGANAPCTNGCANANDACPCQGCPCQGCQSQGCQSQGLFECGGFGYYGEQRSSVIFGRRAPPVGILEQPNYYGSQRFNPTFENGYEGNGAFNGRTQGCGCGANVEATCAAVAKEAEPTCAINDEPVGCGSRFTVGCGAAPGARGVFAGGCHDLFSERAGYSAGTFDLAYLRASDYSAVRSHAEFDAPWGLNYIHELQWFGEPDQNADLKSFGVKFTLEKELEFSQGGHSPLHVAVQYEDSSWAEGSGRVGGGIGVHRLLPCLLANHGVRADVNCYATSDNSAVRMEYTWYVPLLGDNFFYRGYVDQDIYSGAGQKQHVDQSHQVALHLFAGIHAMGEYYADNMTDVHEWRYGVQWMAWFK